MELKRFTLGMRFVMLPESGMTPNDAWEIVFQRIPKHLVEGLTLCGCRDETAETEPEPAYICAFSNASIKKAKRLVEAIRADAVLWSYLTGYRPLVQNNMLEKCKQMEWLGRIAQNGQVAGGEFSYAQMKFDDHKAVCEIPNSPRILIAAEAFDQNMSTASAGRILLRQAAQVFPKARIRMLQIAGGGRGTMDSLVSACDGRYLLLQKTNARCGILPDQTAVLEADGLEPELLTKTMQAVLDSGYQKLILAAGNAALSEAYPEGLEVTVLSNLPPQQQDEMEHVTYRSGIETMLEKSGFLRVLHGAALVITATMNAGADCRMLGSTVDTVLYHCRKQQVPAVVLAGSKDGGFTMKYNDQQAQKLAADNAMQAAAEMLQSVSTEQRGPFKNAI